MSQIDDGGPAFPNSEVAMVRHFDNYGEVTGTSESIAIDENSATPGMSLRDYFAAAALQGSIAHGLFNSEQCKNGGWSGFLATMAYLYADAMLLARKSPQQEAPEPERCLALVGGEQCGLPHGHDGKHVWLRGD